MHYGPQHLTHHLPPRPTFTAESYTHTSSARTQHQSDPYVLTCPIPLSVQQGPRRDSVIYATSQAREKWVSPDETHDLPRSPGSPAPPNKAPIYGKIIKDLEARCNSIIQGYGQATKAGVTEQASGSRRRGQVYVLSICAPDSTIAFNLRTTLMESCPLTMRCATVNLDMATYYKNNGVANEMIHIDLDRISGNTGADIFVLKPEESLVEAAGDPDFDVSQGKQATIAIYGDYECVEHAKTMILIMIDRLLGHKIDSMWLEHKRQAPLCGRGRSNIKRIESQTGCAIYFPPAFPHLYGYTPPGAERRHTDQIYITGKDAQQVSIAKAMISNLNMRAGHITKDFRMDANKLDFILLERLEELKKIVESNGTCVTFPRFATGHIHSVIAVTGAEQNGVDKTCRDIMHLPQQYYDAAWWIAPEAMPSYNHASNSVPFDLRNQIVAEAVARSDALIMWRKEQYQISGSDEAVKKCLAILCEGELGRNFQYNTNQFRVRIEISKDQKEFVAGKKNGKINKIMGTASVQVLFEDFADYNFHVCVQATSYAAEAAGLALIEAELPAAMAFHVPDQYHKRIIGIGGSNIQTIMKRYSVFVKFSNAQDRSLPPNTDDLKVDNVLCRTPSRNAANLEHVKTEIMMMVQQNDANIIEEIVEVPRLQHRFLISQRDHIVSLERIWGCSVSFPSTEQASNSVRIKGPEWQIPHCKEGLLLMVPDSHQIRLTWSQGLEDHLSSEEFRKTVITSIMSIYSIQVESGVTESDENENERIQKIDFKYNRAHAGGLKDAIDLLMDSLRNNEIKFDVVDGRLSRPKSDSFEDFAPYFASAVFEKPPSAKGSQEDLRDLRRGSRASSIYAPINGDHDAESDFHDAAKLAFESYDGPRRSSVASLARAIGPPGSAGSGSSRESQHSRNGSLDSRRMSWDFVSRPAPGRIA